MDVELGQTPLLIVHWKTSTPIPKLNTALFGAAGLNTFPAPDTSDHKPVPTVGVFAARIAALPQTDCEGPALETVGKSSR